VLAVGIWLISDGWNDRAEHTHLSEPTHTQPTVTETPPNVVPTPEQTPEPSNGNNESAASIRIDEITFGGVEISRFIVEPFKDVLGPPSDISYGPFFFYDDLHIRAPWRNDEGHLMAETIHIRDLNLAEIDGHSFPMTHSEVLAIFGEPTDNNPYEITYKVSTDSFDYVLIFAFSGIDGGGNVIHSEYVHHITIWNTWLFA